MTAPARVSAKPRRRAPRTATPIQERRGASRAASLDSSARPAKRSAADRFERGDVDKIQRARLLAAAGQIACERGAGNVVVAHIVQRAGVSRRTFYELFTDGEDCLLAALQDALTRAAARVLPTWRAAGSWSERVRDSLVELLRLFDEEPVLAQLLVVESLGVSHHVLERRAQVLATLAEAMDEGRRGKQSAEAAARLSAEGAIGGALAVLHARIVRRGGESLMELTGALTGMLVLPYEGPAAARRELRRPAPPSTHVGGTDRTDPIRAAGIRLTYRTARVLAAVAEHPGSSNRQVGSLAGVDDPGQISRLLARLERVGMVANHSDGQHRGEPNVWALTPSGERAAKSMRGAPDPDRGSPPADGTR